MIRLTTGDDYLFELLFMLNSMTVDQIQRTRYYQPETGRLSVVVNVCKRLSKLRTFGYLQSEEIYDEQRRRILVYRLGLEALPELCMKNPLISQRRLYKPKEIKAQQVLHGIMVTECAVRIIESLRGSDVVTPRIGPLNLPFYHTHIVGDDRTKRFVQRFVTQEDVFADGQRFRLRPDVVFALERQGKARLFFLEADRGFENRQQIIEKIHAYSAYKAMSSKPWQEYGDQIHDFRVLFVCSSEARVSLLLSCMKDIPGRSLVRLCSLTEMKRINAVFNLGWLRQASTGETLEGPLMR